jgi:hypothetical protein
MVVLAEPGGCTPEPSGPSAVAGPDQGLCADAAERGEVEPTRRARKR